MLLNDELDELEKELESLTNDSNEDDIQQNKHDTVMDSNHINKINETELTDKTTSDDDVDSEQDEKFLTSSQFNANLNTDKDQPLTTDESTDETHEDETHEDETHEDETHEDETHEDETHEDETHEDETHEDETHEDETLDQQINEEAISELEEKIITLSEKQEKAKQVSIANKIKRKNNFIRHSAEVAEEKHRINVELQSVKKKLIEARAREKMLAEETKTQLLKIKQEVKLEREKDNQYARDFSSMLKNKKDNINKLKTEIKNEEKVIDAEIRNKMAEADKEQAKAIAELKLKISFERSKLKTKKLEEKEKAKQLKISIKQESLEQKKLLANKKREQQKELIEKKISLKLEKEQDRILRKERIINEGSKRLEIIEQARKESRSLKEKQIELKTNASKAKIIRKLKNQSMKDELQLEKEKYSEQLQLKKLDNEIEVEEHLRTLESELKDEISKESNKDLSTKIIETTNHDVVTNIVEEEGMESSYQNTNAFEEDFVVTQMELSLEKRELMLQAMCTKFPKFDKNGDKLLDKLNESATNSELKRINNSSYFSTLAENYKQIIESENFVDIKWIIIYSHIMSFTDFDIDIINMEYKILKKALVQRVVLDIGDYTLISSKVEGRNIYAVKQSTISSASNFNLKDLYSESVMNYMKVIVSEKLKNGVAIKMFDGLAIELVGDSVQIAASESVIRLG